VKLRALALPAVLCVGLVGMPTSGAAVGNDIVDPAGDAVAAQASLDITGVDFHMTSTTTRTVVPTRGKNGRKQVVTTVTPKDLVVTMSLGAVPSVQPGVSYQVGAETECGHLFIYSYFSATDAGPTDVFQFSGCGGPDPTATDGEANLSLEPTVTVNGSTISWSVPAKALPKEISLASGWTELIAYTAVTEPVVGYATADFVPESAVDYATGDFAKLG
jgi:hypothetical protein